MTSLLPQPSRIAACSCGQLQARVVGATVHFTVHEERMHSCVHMPGSVEHMA